MDCKETGYGFHVAVTVSQNRNRDRKRLLSEILLLPLVLEI